MKHDNFNKAKKKKEYESEYLTSSRLESVVSKVKDSETIDKGINSIHENQLM